MGPHSNPERINNELNGLGKSSHKTETAKRDFLKPHGLGAE
jgi:hypothetical protein